MLSHAQGQELEKVARAQEDASASDGGPENAALREVNPNAFVPPPTDHGEVRTFWNSFSSAHHRIQEGAGVDNSQLRICQISQA
jgi:oxalate decarboxylase